MPRLRPNVVESYPRTEVTSVESTGDGPVTLELSDGEAVVVDHVVFASGYRADLAAVPYLAGVIDRVSVVDGFPSLSPGFETTLPGLFVTGFAATRDFGPSLRFHQGLPLGGPNRGRGDAGLSRRRHPTRTSTQNHDTDQAVAAAQRQHAVRMDRSTQEPGSDEPRSRVTATALLH